MNLKDFLRILRRRWFWFGVCAVVTFVSLYCASQKQPTFWTATIKVLIQAPEPYQVLERAPARLLPHPVTIATWVDLITDDSTRTEVRDNLKDYFPDEATRIWI